MEPSVSFLAHDFVQEEMAYVEYFQLFKMFLFMHILYMMNNFLGLRKNMFQEYLVKEMDKFKKHVEEKMLPEIEKRKKRYEAK